MVTTPQLAVSEVAERAGAIAAQTHQRIAGVIENMSYLSAPTAGSRPRCSARAAGLRSRPR